MMLVSVTAGAALFGVFLKIAFLQGYSLLYPEKMQDL